jgi:hypothetical protein
MTLLQAILTVEIGALFVSGLCLAPVVLGLALFHRMPGPRVLFSTACWGAVAIVAVLYLAALAS